MVSHVSFLLFLSPSSLAYKVSLSFLAYVFLNVYGEERRDETCASVFEALWRQWMLGCLRT